MFTSTGFCKYVYFDVNVLSLVRKLPHTLEMNISSVKRILLPPICSIVIPTQLCYRIWGTKLIRNYVGFDLESLVACSEDQRARGTH